MLLAAVFEGLHRHWLRVDLMAILTLHMGKLKIRVLYAELPGAHTDLNLIF